MGCPATRQVVDEKNYNSGQLLMLSRQLSIEFRMQVDRLDTEIKQKMSSLKLQVEKAASSRSKYSQQQLLQQVVYKSHLKIIYKILDVQLQNIIQKSNYLYLLNPHKITSPQDEQSKNLFVKFPIQTILFALNIVKDGTISKKNSDLDKFQGFVKAHYPTIKPIETTRHEVLNYYKNSRRPNRSMINQLVFTFCQQQSISLSTFNVSGHDFRY